MSWHKIILTSEQIITGELGTIMNKLMSIGTSSGVPEGFGVFAGKQANKLTPLYFTPASIPYIPDLLAQYGSVPCDKPSNKDIEAFFFGRNDTWELIED